ncbi:YceD family protein [Pseudomonas sp. S 311-6]|uniref:YceD family protein n=1 Tax=Kerstersia TaxID=257820 RepID=UPI0020975736|nr:YceD family protein [Pseudomonas sp. S 311-6]
MGAVVDIFAFVRTRRQTRGEQPLARFTRLVSDLPEQPQGEAGMVRWQAEGVAGRHGESLLRLRAQAQPVVMCQRCLVPFVWPVDVDTLLQPVADEARLEGDAESDDSGDDGEEDEPEKILGSSRFDLLEQVEDELILSIPYAPRHDVCPDASAAGAGDEQEAPAAKRPSPFAVLAKLKK